MPSPTFAINRSIISVKQYLISACIFMSACTFGTAPVSGPGEPSGRPTARGSSAHDFFENKNLFLYGDFDYKTNIGSVLFSPPNFELGIPLIRFNTNEFLLLQFDDLDADYKNYHYTILHCDAYWQPTTLMDFEYIDGFTQDQITDHSPSINTIAPYTHYTLRFPNSNMRPRLSGNYLLIVFLDGDPGNIVFTRRFMIMEQLLPVSGTATLANLVAWRNTHQQVSFTIDMSPYPVSNPYQDLKIVIRQNGRWDNAIAGIAPRMIRGNQLVYDYEDQLLFHGANEFRRFDLRSLRYVTERIGEISTGPRHWDVFLLPDQRRTYRRYTTEMDINGRFQIETLDARNNEREADYAWVHFSLPMDAPVAGGSVHIMGELTQWHLSPENQMTYNYRLGQYEARLLLKQGYYNYWYVFWEDGMQTADVCFFEGCHSQTENEYSILVYHRPPGGLSDRLVGVAHFNTSFRLR